MPTYQYACTTCGHQLEAVQSFSDDPLTECPACEGRLRKVFNSVGVVFKGSGFYRTDSRSSGSESKGTPATGGAKSDSSGGSSTSSGASGGGSSSPSTGGSGSSSGGSSGGGSTGKAPAASTAGS
ncbi:FmdB family transcriptional regulator [Micromonospora sp. PLK6-60]|uniref:FmdB family zinc ribbon protein n=1 Tax=Micromonospora sp. PLK6-60 TaxID=2873383 RepID=UPI001CA6E986|nr:FmdB family zinc ribbon protein [Micromonospora sp. PLK6-60]MBY8871587.1 FmdB family transcriptional regulator [Micromonospora sp. PLK6-60]